MKRYTSLLKEGFISLKSNMLRSLLTILGIVIGIFSVTGMLALGDSLSTSVTKQFNAFSSGDIVLHVVNGEKRVVGEDVLNWVSEKPYVKEVVGILSTNSSVKYKKLEAYPNFYGVLGDYSKFKTYKVIKGKTFDFKNKDNMKYIAVVDKVFEDKFVEKNKKSSVGETILYNNRTPIKVIGVVQFEGNVAFGDGNIYIPYKTAKTIFNKKSFSQIAVNLKDKKHYTIAQKNLKEGINLMYRLPKKSSDVVSSYDNQSFIKQQQKIMSYFSWFLGAIGAIALLVGGIGTMNMILTTVTERKKEIGLRKAIGARSSDITIQILFESMLLTLTGGVIGILFTTALLFGVNKFIPSEWEVTLTVSYSVMLLSIVISIIIGIVFGISPARKAAKMQPTDALRSE